ncbi:MAG: DUF2309 domain-containing protein [Nitrospirales bacterium]
MDSLTAAPYTDAQRMELRSLVKVAGEVIAHVWPMRTFIHHNPLHGLEELDFEQAVEMGQRLLGGRGYLPNEVYRDWVRSGRIRPSHVEAALAPLVRDTQVRLGKQTVRHRDVLRLQFLEGVTAPASECLEALIEASPDRSLLRALEARVPLPADRESPRAAVDRQVQADRKALARLETLGQWCDRTFGTAIRDTINQELIRWCAAFLDEGHATWPLPFQEHTLYRAWKNLVREEWSLPVLGIREGRRKVARLPRKPDDAVLGALDHLGIPKEAWMDYLSLQLAALPGWTGFLKWRSEQTDYVWQRAYPADLVNYLAIRLFYEQALVDRACRDYLGQPGTYATLMQFMAERAETFWLRRERMAGRTDDGTARQVDRLLLRSPRDEAKAWHAVATRHADRMAHRLRRGSRQAAAWRLVTVARAMELDPAVLLDAPVDALHGIVDWLEAFPESRHGPWWLRSLEIGYQEDLLGRLRPRVRTVYGPPGESTRPQDVRHLVQAVFCIDVRSEGFRRHLEALGGYETHGFAGFFGVPIRFRGFGSPQEVSLCPVLVKPKHGVREVPRSYQGEAAKQHLSGTRFAHAIHTVLHDLKLNVITPYVMVEAVGWFFSLPFIGKTLFPRAFHRVWTWLQARMSPPIATTITVDKISRSEAQEMLASEQRAVIRRAIWEQIDRIGGHITPDVIESLRLRAMEQHGERDPLAGRTANILGITPEQEAAFLETLRQEYRIQPHWAASTFHRLTQTGFTLSEQAYFVEAALRLMGLTRNFSRLVLLCGHGSTSDNNPYESALDCGACGGNQGISNARVLAAMANRKDVRTLLAEKGLLISQDTHFLAGQHDTTTDTVNLYDLEDVPPTHRKDLLRLIQDLKAAGSRNSQERRGRLPGARIDDSAEEAIREMQRRSVDWSQVRPEWGLAGNAAMIIGRQTLLQGVNVEGRAFLHSYDWSQDSTGRLLEIIMTAPLVVAQWINAEHYFSTTDNEVYGSGSKVYHNVVGRLGVMFGTQSDLRTGLPRQSVLDGDRPYHEPVRLLVVIEAPRERIAKILFRNQSIQGLFDLRWMHLVVLEPADGNFYRYVPSRRWEPVVEPPTALGPSDERERSPASRRA